MPGAMVPPSAVLADGPSSRELAQVRATLRAKVPDGGVLAVQVREGHDGRPFVHLHQVVDAAGRPLDAPPRCLGLDLWLEVMEQLNDMYRDEPPPGAEAVSFFELDF